MIVLGHSATCAFCSKRVSLPMQRQSGSDCRLKQSSTSDLRNMNLACLESRVGQTTPKLIVIVVVVLMMIILLLMKIYMPWSMLKCNVVRPFWFDYKIHTLDIDLMITVGVCFLHQDLFSPSLSFPMERQKKCSHHVRSIAIRCTLMWITIMN